MTCALLVLLKLLLAPATKCSGVTREHRYRRDIQINNLSLEYLERGRGDMVTMSTAHARL